MTTLYKLGGSGIVIWEAEINESNLIINHGRQGGKMQEEYLPFPSPEKAQTELERRALIKTSKQGYTETVPTSVPQLPMLLQRFDKFGHKLPSSVYVQPKLNGYRGIISRKGVISRRGTHYWSLPHLTRVSRSLPEGIVLDGELYCHGMDFWDHQSVIMRDTFHPDFYNIKFHVFDIQLDKPFCTRYQILKEFCEGLNAKSIELVETKVIGTNEASYYLNEVYKDYEGIVLRDPYTTYEFNKRSYGTQKYKHWQDEEFQIVEIIAAKTGREKGAAIFRVQTRLGTTTDVRPAMGTDQRRSIYRDRDKFIGWWTKVNFEGYSKEGKLLKPTAEGLFSGKHGGQ